LLQLYSLPIYILYSFTKGFSPIIVPSEAKIFSIAFFVDLKQPDKMTYDEIIKVNMWQVVILEN